VYSTFPAVAASYKRNFMLSVVVADAEPLKSLPSYTIIDGGVAAYEVFVVKPKKSKVARPNNPKRNQEKSDKRNFFTRNTTYNSTPKKGAPEHCCSIPFFRRTYHYLPSLHR
jgi:hypothetical protein